MIGEIRKINLPYFDAQQGTMKFKERPALIIAQADTGDFVILPISRVSKREHLHPVYDIEIAPDKYPELHLSAVSYVRTHKQTISNLSEIGDLYGDLKGNYAELYLEILSKRETFSQEITNQSLA